LSVGESCEQTAEVVARERQPNGLAILQDRRELTTATTNSRETTRRRSVTQLASRCRRSIVSLRCSGAEILSGPQAVVNRRQVDDYLDQFTPRFNRKRRSDRTRALAVQRKIDSSLTK
jgi:hypothetical protein